MKILVTGGLGYIGSHTCVKLIEAGYEPIILDNLCNSKKIVLQRIKKITGVEPFFYLGDIRDKGLLNTIFEQNEINVVIHFAGLKSVGESVIKPFEYYDTNVSGSLHLIEVMKYHGIKNLIFSSSATVYGDKDMPPFLEISPTGNVSNPYGSSKLMVEKCCIDFQRAESDWSITLLRYFNPVGSHPSGLIGEDPRGIPNNLMPYISQVAIGKIEYLSIYGGDYLTKDGTGIRDFIHVNDLADGHVAALKMLNEPGCHIYNLGTGIGYSVLDIVAAYQEISGKPIAYKIVPRRSGDIAESWANTDKAKNELGWEAKNNLYDMVRDSWNWQLKNPNGYPDDSDR